jgi:DNA polymerase III subunit epsilon
MYSFTAIDFETANADANSICQIGLIRVEDGKVVKEINQLIQPPRNYYWSSFIKIHGIRPSDTAFSPSFAEAWHLIEPYINSQNIVAHNISFDNNCLKKTLAHYFIPQPEYQTHCTYKIYKKGLAKICAEQQIPLNHHNALSDANACAALFLRHLMNNKIELF